MSGGVVVVATDFSSASAHGLQEVAKRFTEARLVIVHAVDPAFSSRVAAMTGLDGETLQQKAVNRADMQLDETLGALRELGHAAEGAVVEGDLAEALCAAVKKHGAHTLVLAIEPRDGVERLPFRLATSANVPVLILPELSPRR